jgi:hypothetical protein
MHCEGFRPPLTTVGQRKLLTRTGMRRIPEGQNPDSVDFQRQGRHLAVGAGPHGYLGVPSRWLEMRGARGEAARIANDQLAPEASDRVSWPAGLAGTDSLSLVSPRGGWKKGERRWRGSSDEGNAAR